MPSAKRNPASGGDWLFDFQVNGFGGVDFQANDLTSHQLRSAVDALRKHGTAAIFATLVTDRVDRLCHRLERLERHRRSDKLVDEMILGYHLEGPWLSPKPGFCGAHPSEAMHAPVRSEFDRLQRAAEGRIRLVTIAPEWPGSAQFIVYVRQQGVHVALGHTDANETQIASAVAAGARFCTHLGNGVPQMLPRHNNVVQRLLARDDLTACFIPDGIHLPPFVLRNFYRAKPRGRVLFTTDAMAGAGMPPGVYSIGRLNIQVGDDGIARMPRGVGFAGSTLAPNEGVRRTAAYLGLNLDESRRLWSETAAEAFGVRLPKK